MVQRIVLGSGELIEVEAPVAAGPEFVSDLAGQYGGFSLQAAMASRASFVTNQGRTAVRLRTQPGDDNLFGSGAAERCDLALSQELTDGYEGQEAWWAHSIYLPSTYVIPPSGGTWHWGVLMDFHHTDPGGGQANFQLVSLPTGLEFWTAAGSQVANGPTDPGTTETFLCTVTKDVWMDFVYHIKWTDQNDGFIEAWMNGDKVLDHTGPTLYTDQGCYLKLANYHSALGVNVDVIHGRVRRGSTKESVTSATLEA